MTGISDVHIPILKRHRVWDFDNGLKMWLVKCTSSRERRKLLQEVEGVYSQSLNYRSRFRPYSCDCKTSTEISIGKCYRGFLFTRSSEILGGCIFQWRLFRDQQVMVPFIGPVPDIEFTGWWRERHPHSCWSLQWVWLVPEARHTGVLPTAWPTFRELFGIRPENDFYMEGPYSEDFTKFLRSTQYELSYDNNGNLNWMPPG